MSGPESPYRFLLGRGSAPTPVTVVLRDGVDRPTADDLAALLRAVFDADPDLVAVGLRVGHAVAGVVGRARIRLLTERQRAAQDGDGATLPGRSRRYRLLAFRCDTDECAAVEWHVMTPDEPPPCPHGHGALRYDPATSAA